MTDGKEPSSTEDNEGTNEQQTKVEEDTFKEESDTPEQTERKCRRKCRYRMLLIHYIVLLALYLVLQSGKTVWIINYSADEYWYLILNNTCVFFSATFGQGVLPGIFGCLSAVICASVYAAYLTVYHDRKFWFSARQVEVNVYYFILK